MRLIFVIVICVVAQDLYGQSLKERMVSMQTEYAKLDNVHIRMALKVFDAKGDKKPVYTDVAEVKRQGMIYDYTLSTMAMLMNQNYLIVVNKGSREIVYTKRSLDAEKKIFTDPFKVNLDSILSLYAVPQLVETTGSIEHYSVEQKTGIVNQVEIFLDTKENVLRRMEYGYRDGRYVVIDFEVFDKQPVFDAATFSENRYVRWVNGKSVPATAYRGYRIIRTENKKS